MLSFANRLRPLSGYAGIGVLESIDFDARQTSGDEVRKITERFPGLEVEHCIVPILLVSDHGPRGAVVLIRPDHGRRTDGSFAPSVSRLIRIGASKTGAPIRVGAPWSSSTTWNSAL